MAENCQGEARGGGVMDTTQFIIDWDNRMMKRGWCGCVTTEALASFMDEEGNESPSIEACNKAIEWEKDELEMINYIKEQNRWCVAPTLGCRRFCAKYKDPIFNISETRRGGE